MDRRSDRPAARWPALIPVIVLLAFLSVSCSTETVETPPPSQTRLVRMAAERRYRMLLQRGTLRVAVSSRSGSFVHVTADGEFDGPEVRKIRKAAEKAGLRLFLFDVRPEAIPGRIRSGQADLAIGGLKSGEIRSMLLTPVLEYRQGSEEYAFAAWEDARELRELLAR